MLAIASIDNSPLVVAIVVGLGSAAMVQASKLELLSTLPAIVWGFASTVGTIVATGHPITASNLHNPLLVTTVAMATGAVFGIVSETFAGVLTRKPQPSLQ